MDLDRYIPVNGAQIFVHCEGEGTPIVLVHGIALTYDMWKFQVPYLTEHGYQVVALDLRGFGRSQPDKPDNQANYTYEQWADDLRTVISELNLKHVTLAGYSLGGAVVMRYMSDPHPCVEKLALIAATGPNMQANLPFPDNIRLQMTCSGLDIFADLIKYFGKEVAFDHFMNFAFPTILDTDFIDRTNLVQWIKDMFDSASHQALIGGCKEIRTRNITQGVSTICTPTRICHGIPDPFVPFGLGLYQKNLTNADLTPFRASGHALFCEMERELLSEKLAW